MWTKLNTMLLRRVSNPWAFAWRVCGVHGLFHDHKTNLVCEKQSGKRTHSKLWFDTGMRMIRNKTFTTMANSGKPQQTMVMSMTWNNSAKNMGSHRLAYGHTMENSGGLWPYWFSLSTVQNTNWSVQGHIAFVPYGLFWRGYGNLWMWKCQTLHIGG